MNNTFGSVLVFARGGQNVGVRSGFCEQITFNKWGALSEDEKEHCRILSRVNFYGLSRTALYMNDGMTFREAYTKYLSETHPI